MNVDTQPRPWPDEIEARRVEDDAFAEAYARVDALGRARIKTCLAGLFTLYGGKAPRSRTIALEYDDVSFKKSAAPAAWTLVVLDEAFVSPARLAAACMPALCAGTPIFGVARLGGGDWPEPLLLTLELAGVEEAFALDREALENLVRWLSETAGPGALIGLDRAFEMESACDNIPLGFSGRIGVWDNGAVSFDLEALAFAHPDAEIVFPETDEEMETFCSRKFDAVCLPPGPAPQAAGPLVLGPGMEAFWAWPGLTPARFFSHALTVESRLSPLPRIEDP